MIIKLTDVRNDGAKPIDVYVNMQNVLTFNKSMNGKDTHVKLIGNAFLFVKETPEEIVNALSKNPMPQTMIDDIQSGKVKSLAKLFQEANDAMLGAKK
jgi:hypothetical protein